MFRVLNPLHTCQHRLTVLSAYPPLGLLSCPFPLGSWSQNIGLPYPLEVNEK